MFLKQILFYGLNSPGLLLLASTKGTSSKVCNVLFWLISLDHLLKPLSQLLCALISDINLFQAANAFE
jgi:hypothetical protein